MSVFVLGPSEHRDGPVFDAAMVGPYIPPTWRLADPEAAQPIDLRAAIVGLCRHNGVPATMMEMHERLPGESNLGLFNRIERTLTVKKHFLIWPRHCKRAGLDVEIGNLLTRSEQGEPLDLRVFVQEDAGVIRQGMFESLERGQRTRYYGDLTAHAKAIVEWKDVAALLRACLFHARPP